MALCCSAVMFAAQTLYLMPNSNWTQANAQFAMYYFKKAANTDNGWSQLMSQEPGGAYKGEIPDGYDQVIFVRIKDNVAEANWDNKWNQTRDLDVPSADNLYTIKDGVWDEDKDKSETFGTWSKYVAPEKKEITYKVKVPSGTAKCYIAGNWDAEKSGWEFMEMTAVNSVDYQFEYKATQYESFEYKYCADADWAYEELDKDGNQIGNRTYKGGIDEVAQFKAPAVIKWYIKGSFNNWGEGYELKGSDEKALAATITLAAKTPYEFKILRVADAKDSTWYGLPSEGNVMKYGSCTDWVAYKSEGDANQANVGLLSTKAADYTFTVDVTNKDNEQVAPKFSVNIPEGDPSVEAWFIMGSFNNWSNGYALVKDENAGYQVAIDVEAYTKYEFKILRVVDAQDSTWFGLGSEGNVMEYGKCTDWYAYESIGDQNQANVGLLTTKAGSYVFTVDPTNKVKNEQEQEILAPKFSVNIPEPDPSATVWYIKGSFNEWADGYVLTGKADSLTAKIELAANTNYEFKLLRVVGAKDSTWFGLGSEGNVMEYGNCSDWYAYESIGDQNQANAGLKTTKAGEYVFTVDPTNTIVNEQQQEILAPKFSVAIPEPDPVVTNWYIMTSFNEWAAGYALTGASESALGGKVQLPANVEGEFKFISVANNDTTWYGLPAGADPMTKDACTDWVAYKSEGDANQANIVIQTAAAGEYEIVVDVTNMDNGNIAPKFSVIYPEEQAIENVYELNINAPMYNILGAEVDADFHGVVIQNGHKFIR